MAKIKMLEFFSGIGSQHKAMTNIGMDYEVIGTSEWDVNAIISYDAIHTDDGIDYSKDMDKQGILKELENFTFSTDGKKPCDKSKIKLAKLRQLYNANLRSKNMGDITKIQIVEVANLWTYSFPCQDLSISGKRAGLGEGTRSGLLYQIERLLEISREKNELPEYLMLENVKNLVGKEFKPFFEDWLNRLDNLGYNTYWEIINSKNMGIPQNRERLFAISIRKDIDDKQFTFPLPFDNGLRLKDFLEKNVDEKYYISKDKTDKLLAQLKDKQMSKQNKIDVVGNLGNTGHHGLDVYSEGGISPTLKARDYKDPVRVMTSDNQITIPVITPDRLEKRQNGRRFKEDGDPMFTITSQDKHGVVLGEIEDTNTLSRLGNVYGAQFGTGYAGNVWDKDYICPTLTTCQGGGREPHILENTHEIIKEFDIPSDIINDNERQRRVYNSDGISPTVLNRTDSPKILEDFYASRDIREYDECPTLRADRQGLKVLEGNNIIKIDIPQLVKVRKYPVDIESLKILLKSHKKESKLSNKDISDKLNVPKTLVEHWFRSDNCFSIPDADLWMDLKGLLHITTDEFDMSIMEFEEKIGVYEKAERCYHENGIAPCLTSTGADEKIITNELQFVGGIQTGDMWIDDGKELSRNYRSGNRVYDAEGIAITQTSEGGGLAGYTGMYKVEDTNKIQQLNNPNFSQQRIYGTDGIAPTICAGNSGGGKEPVKHLTSDYRIRKLTPRECFILQGFSGSDFDKCKNAGISDSANYKSAGNSITCNVLMGIFGELFNVEYMDKIKDIRAFYNNQDINN